MKKTVLLTMIIGLILVYGKMSLFAQNIPEKANVTKSIDSSIEKIKSNKSFKALKSNFSQNDYSFTGNNKGWSEPMLISTTPGGNKNPVTVIDNDGKVWVGWQNDQWITGLLEPVYVSSYDGEAWAEPTLIDTIGYYESNSSMTVDNYGNVWISWEYSLYGGSPGGDIGVKYYNGTNWSSKMNIPMPSTGFVNAVSNLTVDGSGNIWATWQHRNDWDGNGNMDPEDNFDILSNYYDGTNWLDESMLVSQPDSSAWDWWSTSTTDNDGNVWTTWFSNIEGNYAAFSSYNNGAEWSPIIPVVTPYDSTAWGGEHVDMEVTPDGKIWLTYDGLIFNPEIGMYLYTPVVTYYDGSSWTPLQYISDGWQNLYYDLAADIGINKNNGDVWVTWTGYDLQTEQLYIFLRYWNGTEWLPTIRLTDSGMDKKSKVIIDNESKIWIIWTSFADGEENIYAKYNDDWVNVEENNPSFLLEDMENFPNPFNTSTTISFSVEDSDKNTTITIYNFNGQKIKTLVDKKLSAGTHQIVWDGTDYSGNAVSSGIYFYKMGCGDKYTGFKKMILMK